MSEYRGKRSTLPPEERARIRRDCLNSKPEKADILGTCHDVFQNVANLIHECPDVNAQLLEMTAELRKQLVVSMEEGSKPNDLSVQSADTENAKPFANSTKEHVTNSKDHRARWSSTCGRNVAIPSSKGSAFTFCYPGTVHSTPLRDVSQTTFKTGLPVPHQYPCRIPNSIKSSCSQQTLESWTSVKSFSSNCEDSGIDDSGGGNPCFNRSAQTPMTNNLDVDTPFRVHETKLWRPYLD